MTDPRTTLAESLIDELLEFSLGLAHEARAVALRHFRSEDMAVEYKEPGQPVTCADLEIETLLRERIEKRYPAHGIIGEEHGSVREGSEFQWTLDPIDGTRNFAAGIDTFGNLIAIRYRNRPCVGVIDHPAKDLCVHASFGKGSWCGSKRLRIAATPLPPIIATSTYAVFEQSGEGKVLEKLLRAFPDSRIYYDCFAQTLTVFNSLRATVEFNLKIWDFAPAELIIVEAGGSYIEINHTRQDDGPDRYSAVFGEPEMVREIVRVIRG